MKDYRLSEIKEICEAMHNKYGENACIYCENEGLGDFCNVEFENYPIDWYVDIEPRDMIELPCKDYVFFKDEEDEEEYWFVYYRSTEFNCIDCKFFETEAEADAFLAELKGGKQ